MKKSTYLIKLLNSKIRNKNIKNNSQNKEFILNTTNEYINLLEKMKILVVDLYRDWEADYHGK